MTNQEKLDLLNTLHGNVVDYSCSGGECEYVLVTLGNEARSALKEIGVTDEWLTENSGMQPDDDSVDIAAVAFQLCGARWWNRKRGFSLSEEDETDG